MACLIFARETNLCGSRSSSFTEFLDLAFVVREVALLGKQCFNTAVRLTIQ